MVERFSFVLERSDSPRHRSHVAQLFSLGGSERFYEDRKYTTHSPQALVKDCHLGCRSIHGLRRERICFPTRV